MNELFRETLNNRSRFATYELAMMTLTKCIMILAQRGADIEAMSEMEHAVGLLKDQLMNAYIEVKKKQDVQSAVTDLLKELNIKEQP